MENDIDLRYRLIFDYLIRVKFNNEKIFEIVRLLFILRYKSIFDEMFY